MIYHADTFDALKNYADAVLAKGDVGAGPSRMLARCVLRQARRAYLSEASKDVTLAMQHGSMMRAIGFPENLLSTAISHAAEHLADAVERAWSWR